MNKFLALASALLVMSSLFGCSNKSDNNSEEELGELADYVETKSITINDENYVEMINDIYSNPEMYKDTTITISGMNDYFGQYPYIYRISSNGVQTLPSVTDQIGLRYKYNDPMISKYKGEWCTVSGTLKIDRITELENDYDLYIEADSLYISNYGELNADKFYVAPELPTEESTKSPYDDPFSDINQEIIDALEQATTEPNIPMVISPGNASSANNSQTQTSEEPEG